jgi:PPE-repeat protein
VDFSVLPPEINSARMYAAAGKERGQPDADVGVVDCQRF